MDFSSISVLFPQLVDVLYSSQLSSGPSGGGLVTMIATQGVVALISEHTIYYYYYYYYWN
jgi:hypothetical protein